MPKAKNVFWIYGNSYDCTKKWNALCNFVKDKSGKDVDIETVCCGINSATTLPQNRLASVENVIYQLRSKNIFNDNVRIIKIVGIPKNYKDLVPYLNLTSSKNILVFWGNPGYYTAHNRWTSIKNSNLYKVVKKEGKVFEFPIVLKNKLESIRWLKGVCEDCKIKIHSEALNLMVDLEGFNLDILNNALLKVKSYEPKKKITVEDVRECCRHSFQTEVWSYLKFLDEGKYNDAISFLQQFYNVSPSPGESFYGRVNKLFGAIKQHFLFLMAAKDICPQQLKAKDLESGLKTFKKSTSSEIQKIISGDLSIDDLSPIFSSGYIYNQLNNRSLVKVLSWKKSRIYQILADVYTCMFLCRYRSGDDSYIKLCLDTFTMHVCGKISLRQSEIARCNSRKCKLYNFV